VSPEGPASRREIEDTTAARLAEIVAAAEQAAKGVIDEAEAEARERLADATEEADRIVAERLDRLAGLTEDLDLRAEALKRGAEALRAALAEARSELGGVGPFAGTRASDEPTPPVESDPGLRREPGPSLSIVGGAEPGDGGPDRDSIAFQGRISEPDPDGTPDRFESRSSSQDAPDFEAAAGDTPAGARLLATQMAVSGSTRDEIEQRLRSGFQIVDTTSILDAILGPER
jgi:vacuolar-type H+-ATPase subunit H